MQDLHIKLTHTHTQITKHIDKPVFPKSHSYLWRELTLNNGLKAKTVL